jgi:LuxR family maltose regulon positive regulatory protein
VAHVLGLLYTSSLRVLLESARPEPGSRRLRAGIRLADRIIASARRGPYLVVLLDALLLRARLFAASSRDPFPEAALTDCLEAVRLAQPDGFITVFLEHGAFAAAALDRLLRQQRLDDDLAGHTRAILAAFPGNRPVPPPTPGPAAITPPAPLAEPLTERELEVLQLIATGLKYREIATRLVISLNTVRFHVKAVYGKLGANNRTQAVTTARRLGIL